MYLSHADDYPNVKEILNEIEHKFKGDVAVRFDSFLDLANTALGMFIMLDQTEDEKNLVNVFKLNHLKAKNIIEHNQRSKKRSIKSWTTQVCRPTMLFLSSCNEWHPHDIDGMINRSSNKLYFIDLKV